MWHLRSLQFHLEFLQSFSEAVMDPACYELDGLKLMCAWEWSWGVKRHQETQQGRLERSLWASFKLWNTFTRYESRFWMIFLEQCSTITLYDGTWEVPLRSGYRYRDFLYFVFPSTIYLSNQIYALLCRFHWPLNNSWPHIVYGN